jgi:hypothetical protein
MDQSYRVMSGRRLPVETPPRLLRFGMSSLSSAQFVATLLQECDLDVEPDVGDQGWPATLTLRPPMTLDLWHRAAWRRVVVDAVQEVDPRATLLRQRKRAPSLRVACPRAATPVHTRRIQPRSIPQASEEGTP